MLLPALALLDTFDVVLVVEVLGACDLEELPVGEALGVALGEEVLAVQISAEKSSLGAVLLHAKSPMLPM